MDALVILLLSVFLGLALHVYYNAWVKPERIRRKLRWQGIRGPPPEFFHGNLKVFNGSVMEKQRSGGEEKIRHDYASNIFPYFEKWRKIYGPIFVYTTGNVPMLHVSHPDFVKEMNLCRSLDLGKATYLQRTHEPLFGHGILKSNGESWAYQRRIIAPEFFMDKVKGMVDLMVGSAITLWGAWERRVDDGGGMAEIKIDEDLKSYSAEVISRASFGSSYSKGKEIFLKLYQLKKAVSKPNLLVEITGIRHIPTRSNREVWRLNKEIRALILEVVKNGSREGRNKTENNLLQAILCSAGDAGGHDAEDFVVDNCKTIYFAGHETTSVAATWCLFLLALHPDWQERVRAETAELCGGQPPNSHSLLRMKTLTMVIHETLRLYPPGPLVSREALRDIKLGGIQLPKGINIFVPVLALHQDRSLWGDDACEFNPQRFAHGILGACQVPHVYVPFGAGPRTCLGQNFAMVELKVVLALILQRFSFTLSPKYRHSPKLRLIVEPEYGVDLVMKKVK